MAEDSVFTKIIKGELPSHKIYEDDKTLAFMDIHPVQPGHVVVVPKRQVNFVWDLDDQDYIALMKTVQKISKKMREVFPDKKRVGVQIEGLGIDNHAHVNILPFSTVEEFRRLPNTDDEPDHEALENMAEKLHIE